MPTYQGQTDQVLRIQLPSGILSARFLESRFPANADIAFEVLTLYVGDTAPIEIDFVDIQGSVLHTHRGTVQANSHRGRLPGKLLAPKPGPALQVQMKVRLPKHGLNHISSWARIDAPIALTEVSIQNLEGSVPAKVCIGDTLKLSAKLLGDTEGLPCNLSLEVRYTDGHTLTWQSFDTEVKDGKAQIECIVARKDETRFSSQHRLKPLATSYAAPVIYLRANCMGLTACSPEKPLISRTGLVSKIKARAQIETPSGSKQTIELEAGQAVDIPPEDVGMFRLLDLEPLDDKGQTMVNQIVAGESSSKQEGASEKALEVEDEPDEEQILPLPPMTEAP